MNKMERLHGVNETIAELRSNSVMLGDLCGKICNYVSEEKFLPADLQDQAMSCLQAVKDAQGSCGEGFNALTGSAELPETFAEAEDKMDKLHELFCKEEILQAAERFRNLVTENPEEIDALRVAQERIVIADPAEMTLDGCRERYQPYIDFLTTLEEEDAGKRIKYVRKLEEYFSAELIAGAVITRDIHDPVEIEIPFVEEDLDDYDEGTEDTAIPSAMSEEETDDISDEMKSLTEEVAGGDIEEEIPREIEAAEEIPEEPSEEDAAAEEAAEEVTAAEETAEEAEVKNSFREEPEDAAGEENAEDETEDGKEDAETVSIAEFPEIENYLDDFDEKYIEYYRLATGKEEEGPENTFAAWPQSGETFGPEGVKNVLESIGFHVENIEEHDKIRDKYENYRVILDKQDGQLSGGESVALANFRHDACEDGFRVVCLYGAFSGEELSRAFREIGNRHHTLILFQNPVTQGVRRSLVRLVRREGLRKIFAVLDRVAYEYMNRNYREDEINRIFLDIIMPGPDTK